ncbi:nucleolin 2-like [Nicotiana tomentosiformis]|uniref:nucleolin 2-like n=1 Tax=Nicotiana tomentosiformis TaxID=4098 RepID=UPI00388C627D
MATSSPPVSSGKQGEQGNMVEEGNHEISNLAMEETSIKEQATGPDNADTTTTGLESTNNTPPSAEISMEPQKKEEDDTTGIPNNGPDPSTEDPAHGSSPQVSIDPVPSPHFYAEHLSMVMPEMRSDSEEDLDDLVIASFIRARSKPVATPEPTPKRPTTRLQKKEALESALKKSQQSQRRRKLAKDGKAVLEKVVHVVNVDEEVEDKPSSLTHKPSKQKHSLSKSKKTISVTVEIPTKGADAVSSEKFGEKSSEKIVKESSGKSDDEVVEDSGENVPEKSVEKGKSTRKLVKRKMDIDEEPGSSKKAKVEESQSSGKGKLRNQKVLWGHTFVPDIVELVGMRQLVEICDFQQWTHLFTTDVPKVYEEEVWSFYADFFKVEDDHIFVLVNGVDIVMDFALLGSILGVPAEGLSSVQGACSSNFRNAIVNDKAIQ